MIFILVPIFSDCECAGDAFKNKPFSRKSCENRFSTGSRSCMCHSPFIHKLHSLITCALADRSCPLVAASRSEELAHTFNRIRQEKEDKNERSNHLSQQTYGCTIWSGAKPYRRKTYHIWFNIRKFAEFSSTVNIYELSPGKAQFILISSRKLINMKEFRFARISFISFAREKFVFIFHARVSDRRK